MTYKTVFQIINLHCTGCAQLIKTSLKRFSEVKSIELDFSGSSVTIEYQGEESFSQVLFDHLRTLGFTHDSPNPHQADTGCCLH